MIVGLGIDLVDIARVEKLLAAKEQRALDRLFTEAERRYALARARPAMHLAARLAAKEAAFKALAGNGLARAIGWRDVEVVSTPAAERERDADESDSPANGPHVPTLRLHGRAAERAAELGVERIFVSLSHSSTTAAAVVLLEASAR